MNIKWVRKSLKRNKLQDSNQNSKNSFIKLQNFTSIQLVDRTKKMYVY